MVGKVVLVSGAGSIAGRHCAQVLADAGASLMLADGDFAALDELGERYRARGVEAHTSVQDVRDENRWEALVSNTVDRLGGLDVLVNCGWGCTALEYDRLSALERMHLQYQSKIDALFLGMKYAALAMRPDGSAGKGGAIVNLAVSVTDVAQPPLVTGTGAVDGTIREYTRLAAAEFGSLGYGIRVNVIADGRLPGAVVDFDDPDARTLKDALLFLASNDSAHLNGVEWPIDGPWFTAMSA